jgi:hypothetical protein
LFNESGTRKIVSLVFASSSNNQTESANQGSGNLSGVIVSI